MVSRQNQGMIKNMVKNNRFSFQIPALLFCNWGNPELMDGCSLIKEGVDIWNRNNDILFSLMLYFCWSIPNQDTIQLRNCTDPLDTRTYNFLSFLNWYIQSMLCNQSLLKTCSNKKSKLNTFVILVVCYFWNTYLSAFIYCNL